MNSIRSVISYSKLSLSLFLNPYKVNIALKCQLFTKVKVNDYLLDRSIPASEILNNLLKEDAIELENIKKNYELLYSQGELVPKVLTDKHYLELLCLSKNQQLKYYKFLASNEIKEQKDKQEKLKRLTLDSSERPLMPNNRFVTKYIKKSADSLILNNLYQSIVLRSQEFVFDAAFEDTMSMQEVKNLAKQLLQCYGCNKLLKEPYQIVFTNLERKSVLYNILSDFLLNKTSTARCTNIHQLPFVFEEKSYKDIFPDRRLIYLSPDSNRPFRMGEYDHDAVYICGAIVDKGDTLPLTLGKARKDHIEHRSFPIDEHVQWVSGTKSMTLNASLQMMAIARETNGDWELAIKSCVPQRSLKIRHPRSHFILENDIAADYV